MRTLLVPEMVCVCVVRVAGVRGRVWAVAVADPARALVGSLFVDSRGIQLSPS